MDYVLIYFGFVSFMFFVLAVAVLWFGFGKHGPFRKALKKYREAKERL